MENGTGYKSTGTGWSWDGPDQGYHAAIQHAAGVRAIGRLKCPSSLHDAQAGGRRVLTAFNGGSARLPAPSSGNHRHRKPTLPDVEVDAKPCRMERALRQSQPATPVWRA